ncbi:MAG: hypothetical protein MAGBODY4_01357 [Candidatus Marinimicrobia bacterium]|nr:hypothetical protein [Candidatus Neomarinimicrobiota bacterium]
MNEAKSDGTPFDVDYSGLEMEYIGRPMDLIHYSVYLLIGGGDIRERKDDNPLNSVLDADGIFVIAPEANLLVNVTERFLWEPGWDIAGSMAWKSWD